MVFFTLPQNPVVNGETGHLTDHGNIYTGLRNLWGAATQDYLNVQAPQFGAKGDGSHDDTTAIQAALNQANTNHGGVVYLPGGEYRITAPLVIYSHTALIGGMPQSTSATGGTQITMSTTNTDMLTGTDLTFVSVKNIWFQGTGSGTGNGIKFTLTSNAANNYLSFDRVTVAQQGNNGIDIQNPIVTSFVGVNCQLNGNDGFYIHGKVAGAAGTSTAFLACYGITNTGNGFNIYNMTGLSMLGCASDNHTTAGKAGVLIDTCNGTGLYGMDIENNAIGILVNAGYGTTVSSYFNYANAGVGLSLTNSATGVVALGIVENGPGGGATAWVKTTTGSEITMLSSKPVTANSLASGTVVLKALEATLQFIKSGSTTATIDNFGGTLVTNCNVALPSGGTLRMPTGTAASASQGTLTANGTTAVVVNTTAASANANIYYTLNAPAGTVGQPYTSAVVGGTSFSFKSTNAADTSTYNWFMLGTT